MKLSGQVALITGAARGIGRATALAFAERGIKVVIADINTAGAEETVKLITDAGGTACFIHCDVRDEEQVKQLVARTVEIYGSLDYAFNNAGIEMENQRVHEGSLSSFEMIMDVNVKGVWLCMKYQLQQMLVQGKGAIVNAASVAGLGAAPKMAVYSASKHAVLGLTRSAAIEYARKNIRVNAVCPAVIDTAMYQRVCEMDPRIAQRMPELHPMGRVGRVEEVAETVMYLCSEGAGFTTGHALAVDGGMTAI
ncbi:SDR family oxidoreductase [Pseudomonas sp. C27(2019)]|uniref:SDR family oxidoreductase n=1 Tax=Pseudomonas sp. C27(2019) TaxID=2604941 RepID=UPI001243F121|nr:SDR family oxidoreductase [Pseudomonas sp. C27(2019)]QEY59005.1 SDR family oxidoreductase [Pseudomonas sp. C27(2019)]